MINRIDISSALNNDVPALELKKPLPWKLLATAGRAHEGLREGWRNQFRMLQREVGFSYLRFHGLFMDEMMVYHEREDGGIEYNWRLIDELFDFLLDEGCKPFVELSFMPDDLASDEKTIFWWKGRIAPPKSMAKWNQLIAEFIKHCIHRYGRQEVRTWYFEVWNEPNLKDWFWSGSLEDYFELYDNTVAEIRAILPEARVGGPSTSNFKDGEAPWLKDFLRHCRDNEVPLDFVSTHPYPNNFPLITNPDNSTGFLECYRDPGALREDLAWIQETITEEGFANLEVHITEWNLSPNARDLLHDTRHAGCFALKNNLEAIDLTDSLGWWVFSDIFEETRAGIGPFHGGFGLINQNGIPKPAYHAYRFLSELGEEIISLGSDHAIGRDENGQIVILIWNYVHYSRDFADGDRSLLLSDSRETVFLPAHPLTFEIASEAFSLDGALFDCELVCKEQGDALTRWIELGANVDISREEEQDLLRASVPRRRKDFLKPGESSFTLTLEPHDFAKIIVSTPGDRVDRISQ
jgi:xylan 1,4-beta-xylosidase